MGKIKKLVLAGLFTWAGKKLNKQFGSLKVNKSGKPNKKRSKK